MSYAKYTLPITKVDVDRAIYDVDHINGDKLDNRIENLQVISSKYNQQNVCFMKASELKKWLNTQVAIFGEDFDIKLVRSDENGNVKLVNAQKHYIIQNNESDEKFILIL